MKVFLFLLFFSHLQELCLNWQGNTFQELSMTARKSQWCHTKKEYKVTDFSEAVLQINPTRSQLLDTPHFLNSSNHTKKGIEQPLQC